MSTLKKKEASLFPYLSQGITREMGISEHFIGVAREPSVLGVAGSEAVGFKGLKERPLKGPLGLYGGFMRLYKGYRKVI